MRVLLAVESDSVIGVLEALFTARGYEVLVEKNGAKALEAAFASLPDAVVVSVELSGPYDGIEVCQRLRSNAATREVPVLVLAQASDEDVRTRAQEAGSTGSYTLPVSPSAVLKEIETLRPRAHVGGAE
jgi:DNA-binding response OmpR family regulator